MINSRRITNMKVTISRQNWDVFFNVGCFIINIKLIETKYNEQIDWKI